MSDRTEALSVAWEQVAHWRTYLTASEACAVVGLRSDRRAGWEDVANKLAALWIGLQRHEMRRAA